MSPIRHPAGRGRITAENKRQPMLGVRPQPARIVDPVVLDRDCVGDIGPSEPPYTRRQPQDFALRGVRGRYILVSAVEFVFAGGGLSGAASSLFGRRSPVIAVRHQAASLVERRSAEILVSAYSRSRTGL
jgi:hypothetical protein